MLSLVTVSNGCFYTDYVELYVTLIVEVIVISYWFWHRLICIIWLWCGMWDVILHFSTHQVSWNLSYVYTERYVLCHAWRVQKLKFLEYWICLRSS